MRTNTALLSLSVGAFAIGATEFSPMGMLPEIAGHWLFPFLPPGCWLWCMHWA